MLTMVPSSMMPAAGDKPRETGKAGAFVEPLGKRGVERRLE